MRISDWSSDVCSSDLLEPAAWRGLEVGIGVDVEDTDAFDAIIVDPPVDRAGVETPVQVGDEDSLRIDARRAQAQIIAEDAAVRIGEVAVEADNRERAARHGVEPANPRGAPRNGDDDLVGIDARLDRKSTRLNSSH